MWYLFILLLLVPAIAEASVMSTVTSWITGEVVALVASAILAVVMGIFGVLIKRITTTLVEAGEFLTVLGTSLSDGKLSKDEIASIISEAKDVFNIWAKTPEKYRT